MKTATKDHPILFKGRLVRAILEGRKTQTRRVIRPQPEGKNPDAYPDRYNHGPQWAFWLPDNRMTEEQTWKCPYGDVGDQLWVRETWYCDHYYVQKGPYLKVPGALELLCYRADPDVEDSFEGEKPVWKPSIHMPRWASRIQLEVVSVKVQRIQDISEEDAEAEGVEAAPKPIVTEIPAGVPVTDKMVNRVVNPPVTMSYAWAFQHTWKATRIALHENGFPHVK